MERPPNVVAWSHNPPIEKRFIMHKIMVRGRETFLSGKENSTIPNVRLPRAQKPIKTVKTGPMCHSWYSITSGWTIYFTLTGKMLNREGLNRNSNTKTNEDF